MEKLEKFFITTLVAGMVTFSSILVVPTQVTQALITTNKIEDNPITVKNDLIGTDQIKNNAITSPKIKDGEVKSQDLANGAVTKDKISPFALQLVTVGREVDYWIDPQTANGVSVQCIPGEVVTGGGFGTADQSLIFLTSRPMVEANKWVIYMYNPTDTKSHVTVWAVCAHLAPGL